MTALSYRPGAPEDEPFLLELYAESRAEEMAQIPWPDEQKRAFLQTQAGARRQHYDAYYPSNQHLIVLRGDGPVGHLWFDRKEERIHILDIAIHTRYCNEGIGTAVMKGLQAEAAESGKAVTIYVESYSCSLPFFVRLGFEQVDQTGAHLLLQWRPAVP